MDRAPEYFPIADCREGENAGLTAWENGSVKVDRLDIKDPVDVKNVDPSQRWCVVSHGNPCNCKPQSGHERGHIQPNGPEGTVKNMKYCTFLKALDASARKPGKITHVKVCIKPKINIIFIIIEKQKAHKNELIYFLHFRIPTKLQYFNSLWHQILKSTS